MPWSWFWPVGHRLGQLAGAGSSRVGRRSRTRRGPRSARSGRGSWSRRRASRRHSAPSGAVGVRRQQVADAEEAGHEPRARALVQARRVAELLVPAVVHDRDAIGHRHRFFLVVGHEDERDPDLLLDPLQLDLHLLAQLQVEGAERLVEQQDGRPVDQRPRQRDALRLAAGDLGRLAPLEAGQLDELEHLRDAAS